MINWEDLALILDLSFIGFNSFIRNNGIFQSLNGDIYINIKYIYFKCNLISKVFYQFMFHFRGL